MERTVLGSRASLLVGVLCAILTSRKCLAQQMDIAELQLRVEELETKLEATYEAVEDDQSQSMDIAFLLIASIFVFCECNEIAPFAALCFDSLLFFAVSILTHSFSQSCRLVSPCWKLALSTPKARKLFSSRILEMPALELSVGGFLATLSLRAQKETPS